MRGLDPEGGPGDTGSARGVGPLSATYRWWVTASHDTEREQVELRYEDLARPPRVERVDAR